MSLLKKLPSQARINQVKELSASIFGHTWNPSCKRNGAKILKADLRGPEISKYYGVNDSMPTFSDFKQWFPELKLVDPKEAYRLHMVQDRKKRNKGAPKKKSKSG
ncbi:mitochondrial ribosome small subunit component [Scheffersomyces xylosifermentans]|uniref:mitochondrial ribosome small subunit component n=1 Tax=Scheffersomyces xylosifermentans TaxID=1304137 RepID=UPI00315D16AA